MNPSPFPVSSTPDKSVETCTIPVRIVSALVRASLLLWCVVLLCIARLEAAAVGAWTAGEVRTFWGACDASAVVSLGGDRIAVADDEDSILRIYALEAPGQPVAQLDLSRFLGLRKGRGETDIEAATRVGETNYWITSHGRNSSAKFQQQRHRFFATQDEGVLSGTGARLKPVGVPYVHLARDLTAHPKLAPFHLGTASKKAPKAQGGFNLEGLVATESGALLLGFRNPIPESRALVVPLLNPDAVIRGAAAQFGDPILLDLGGLGIRGMTRWGSRYLILAGPSQGDRETRLYEWTGGAEPPVWRREVSFKGLNPEAMTWVPGGSRSRLLVLSDDGTRLCEGVECKRLKDPLRKRFRAVVLTPP